MKVVELVERVRGLSQSEFAARVQSGERAALREVYERTHQRLHRFALSMTGDADLAGDALQETFMQLIRRPDQFDPARGSIDAFLYGVLRNRLRQQRRDRRGMALEFDWEDCEESGDESLLDGLLRSAQVSLVREAILSLPSHYREVVSLIELEETSYDEAAEILGVPVGTIRSRLNRARALLEKKLKEGGMAR
jgi:RNA polymerase sigma-70 factor (ECF subfamily)